jgi:hypothetical protein
MNNVKLEDKSTIGILDPTRVSQASHTVTLRKQSEMYKDMTVTEFNKDVARMSKTQRRGYHCTLLRQLMCSCKEARKPSRFYTF